MAMVHEAQFEFSCHGTCKARPTKKGQGDISGIPDIRLQCSVTLCGASLVAGNAAADVFCSILTLSHALSTGLHRLACAILQAEPVFGRVEAVSMKTRSTCCVRLSVLLWQQTTILVNFLYRHAKSLLLKTNLMTLIHDLCFNIRWYTSSCLLIW